MKTLLRHHETFSAETDPSDIYRSAHELLLAAVASNPMLTKSQANIKMERCSDRQFLSVTLKDPNAESSHWPAFIALVVCIAVVTSVLWPFL